jgi:hypothetical protein
MNRDLSHDLMEAVTVSRLERLRVDVTAAV